MALQRAMGQRQLQVFQRDRLIAMQCRARLPGGVNATEAIYRWFADRGIPQREPLPWIQPQFQAPAGSALRGNGR